MAQAHVLSLSLNFGLIHSRTVLRMCNTSTNQMARFALTSCAGVNRLSAHAIVSTHAQTERGAEPGSGEALLRSSIKGQNAACVESVCSLQRMQTKEKMTKKRPVVESVAAAADEELKKVSKEKRQKLEKRITEKAENSTKSRKEAEILVRIEKESNADGTTYWRKAVGSGEAKTKAKPVAVAATRRVISKGDNERKKAKFNVADIPETQPEVWPESGESEDEMEVEENSNSQGEEIEEVERTEEADDDDDGEEDDDDDDERDENDADCDDADRECADGDEPDTDALDVEGDAEDDATEELDVVGDAGADRNATEEENKEADDIVITSVTMPKKSKTKKDQDKKALKKPPTTKGGVAASTSRATGVTEKQPTGKAPTSSVTVKPAVPLFDKMQGHGKPNIYLYISIS